MKKFTSYSFLLLLTLSSFWAVGYTPFYSQDFSGGGIPNGWQNIDSIGNGVKWHWTTTGAYHTSLPVTTFLSPTGTTAANGYLIFDSDSAFLMGNGVLVTKAISCVGKSHVHLNFNEYFAQYNASIGVVSVSNDGLTWTDVHHAETGLGQDQSTANPNAVDIDISLIADGQATVYVRYWYKDIGSPGYFWMIDDIQLYELPVNDVGVTMINSPTTSCNFSLSTTVSVTITNFGADTISGFPVSYQINAFPAVLESCTSSIPPGGSLVYTFGTPGAIVPGINTIVSYTSVPSDLNILNDSTRIVFYNGPHPVIDNYVYTDGFESALDTMGWLAVDVNNNGTTWDLGTLQPNTGSGYANLNEPNADDWYFSTCLGLEQNPADSIYKLDFFYRTFSPSYAAQMEVRLFAVQNPTSLSQSIVPVTQVTYTVNSYNQSSTLFNVPAPGIYYLGFHGFGVSGTPTSLEIDDIDLRLVKAVGVSAIAKNTTDVVLYPNPNTGMFYLGNLNSFNGPVSVNVFDMMGNSVYNQTVNADKLTIDLANQAAGVYMVRMAGDKQLVTKLVTITR